MDQLYMPIQMVLISKAHDALNTLIIFKICMGNHMSFEMRSSFKGFLASILFADIIAFF